MSTAFVVFAGLGSDAQFSTETLRRIAKHADSPECMVLLQACHKAFCNQVSDAIQRRIIAPDVIDIHDFSSPISLACPPSQYRRNVLIQHTSLFLQQAISYLSHQHLQGQETLAAAVGCCTGLLPAAAAATGGGSVLTLVSRFYEFFQLALWIGIRSEVYRREHLAPLGAATAQGSIGPCSYVVDGLSPNEVAEIISAANLVCALAMPLACRRNGNECMANAIVRRVNGSSSRQSSRRTVSR